MRTLAAQVRQGGPLAAADAVGWAIRLAKRVEELHRLGVAHGGISAACVMTDGRERTSPGTLADVRSSPDIAAYHSPERLAGGGISQADDSWAVAATLYYLLTATLPYPGDSPADVKGRIIAGPPQPLAVLEVGDTVLQEALDWFLNRDSAQRVVKIGSIRDALERWPGAPGLSNLRPLEETDTDAFGEDEFDDDDDDDVATVMKDFTEIRAELDAMYKERGEDPPVVSGPPAAPTPGVSARPPGPPVPPPPTFPAERAPVPGPPPPAVSAPPRSPVPPDDDDDADGEADLATIVMSGPAADEVQAAVQEALGQQQPSGAPPPAPGPRPAAGNAPIRPAAGQPAIRPAAGQPPSRPAVGTPPPAAASAPQQPAASQPGAGVPASPPTQLLEVGGLLGAGAPNPSDPDAAPRSGPPSIPPIPQFDDLPAPGPGPLPPSGPGRPSPPVPAGAAVVPPSPPAVSAAPPPRPSAPAGMAAAAARPGGSLRPPLPGSPSMRPPQATGPAAPMIPLEISQPPDRLRTWLGVAIIVLMVVLAVVGLLWLRRSGIVEIW